MNMGTTDKQLRLKSYQQAHVFYFFVKEVCIYLSMNGTCTFKGVEAAVSVGGN